MRREPDFFEDAEELVLVYIAKRLRDALKLEDVLTQAGIDYLVEPDKYRGGLIFQSERVGAFFYVSPGDTGNTYQVMREHGYKPHRLD